MKAAINTLDNIVIKRPSSKMFKKKQNLCLDKGYDFQETKDDVSRKDTYHTFDIEENNLQQNAVIIILREEDGLLRELTPGTTGSENFWSDTKKSMKTILL
jgi:acetone carboxylase gamma subunit